MLCAPGIFNPSYVCRVVDWTSWHTTPMLQEPMKGILLILISVIAFSIASTILVTCMRLAANGREIIRGVVVYPGRYRCCYVQPSKTNHALSWTLHDLRSSANSTTLTVLWSRHMCIQPETSREAGSSLHAQTRSQGRIPHAASTQGRPGPWRWAGRELWVRSTQNAA